MFSIALPKRDFRQASPPMKRRLPHSETIQVKTNENGQYLPEHPTVCIKCRPSSFSYHIIISRVPKNKSTHIFCRNTKYLYFCSRVSLIRPAPAELPQARNRARVCGRSGAIQVAYPFLFSRIGLKSLKTLKTLRSLRSEHPASPIFSQILAVKVVFFRFIHIFAPR